MPPSSPILLLVITVLLQLSGHLQISGDTENLRLAGLWVWFYLRELQTSFCLCNLLHQIVSILAKPLNCLF